MKVGIMYFRRDLRISDNTALNYCINNNDQIIPVFIFNPKQINKNNKYFSQRCLDLLKQFVVQLDNALDRNLLILRDDPYDALNKLLNKLKDHEVMICFNVDFTPFSIARDSKIFGLMKKHNNLKICGFVDHLLVDINREQITESKQLIPDEKEQYYKKFTPFYEAHKGNKIPDPKTTKIKKIYKILVQNLEIKDPGFPFDRKHALGLLKKKINYSKTHDDVFDESGTYNISHYLKFGIISIREAYHSLSSAARRQLYWRDFYTIISWHNPKMLIGQISNASNNPLIDKYNKINWSYDKSIIKAWKDGQTGFPIVDAGMRQLKQTGLMHNRARLITASFLTKICGIDWRIGEQWFAQNLIDYDPIINNGNWLWVAGGGADSQPYFRVFNPWLQQIAHDPECIYIKRWIPELKDIDQKIIHKWFDKYLDNPKIYTPPIIDYSEMVEKTHAKYIRLYK